MKAAATRGIDLEPMTGEKPAVKDEPKELDEMSNAELIAECIALDTKMKNDKKLSNAYKAELQARAIEIMNDKNVRFIKFYGSNSFASVTDAMKLDILNLDGLKQFFSEGIVKRQITETEEIKYKVSTVFEKVLKAIFTGDYTFECSLEEFLDQMSVPVDAKQKNLLLKNLKGEYDKDKETLLTTLKYKTRKQKMEEVEAPDFEVELWYIYKVKNGELIKAFLPEEGIDDLIKQIRKCIMVEGSTQIKIDYDKEKMEETE